MKRKALWALIGVFALGLGSGVLLDRTLIGYRWWKPSSGKHWTSRGGFEQRQARLMSHLTRELELSPDQQAKIEPILKESWTGISKLSLRLVEDIDRLLESTGERIRSHLNAEQTRKFEEFMEKFRKKSTRWRNRLRYPR